MRTSLLLCLALPVASACVTDSVDEADVTDPAEPSVSTTASPLCSGFDSPPPYDWRYQYTSGSSVTFIRNVHDYGSTTCANYVVKLDAGTLPNAGTLRPYMTTSNLPTSATACVQTSVAYRTYRSTSAGVVVSSDTVNAEWTATGCVMPRRVISAGGSPTVELSAQRAGYCPGGGPLCVVPVYGLPIRLEIDDN